MVAIAADPDLGQSAKLFALCLLAYLVDPSDARQRRGGRRRQWAEAVGEMMTGESRQFGITGPAGAQVSCSAVEAVRRVIANDIPRYRVSWSRSRCPVVKTRGKNAGQPCGRSGSHRWVDRDPQTGQATEMVFCRDHYDPAAAAESHRRAQQWTANGEPVPAANAGGILARHFSADWAALYAWADPDITPLPEGKPATPPRPALRLIHGQGAPGGQQRQGWNEHPPLALRAGAAAIGDTTDRGHRE